MFKFMEFFQETAVPENTNMDEATDMGNGEQPVEQTMDLPIVQTDNAPPYYASVDNGIQFIVNEFGNGAIIQNLNSAAFFTKIEDETYTYNYDIDLTDR